MKKQVLCAIATVTVILVVAVAFLPNGKLAKDLEKTAFASSVPLAAREIDIQTSSPTGKDNRNPQVNATLNSSPDFVAGGHQWSLALADQTLTRETQERIKFDLSLVFGHMTKFVVDTLDNPLMAENGLVLDRRLRFEGGTLRRPDALKVDDFGCLFRGGGETEIYVPRSVTDAYLKALELEAKHQVTLSMLGQFLEQMSRLIERPIENVRDIFVFADDNKIAEGGTPQIDPAEFAAAWGGKEYRAPSILDVAETSGTTTEKYGLLIAETYTKSGGTLKTLPPLVFSHDRWRFLLQRPQT